MPITTYIVIPITCLKLITSDATYLFKRAIKLDVFLLLEISNIDMSIIFEVIIWRNIIKPG